MIELLTVALFFLQCCDWYTTRVALLSGKGHEANPVAKKIMDAIGMDEFLGSKCLFVTALGYWIGMQRWEILAGLVVFYVCVIVNNFRVLNR